MTDAGDAIVVHGSSTRVRAERERSIREALLDAASTIERGRGPSTWAPFAETVIELDEGRTLSLAAQRGRGFAATLLTSTRTIHIGCPILDGLDGIDCLPGRAIAHARWCADLLDMPRSNELDATWTRVATDLARMATLLDDGASGACTLRPGVPGLSENIRVRSIIGRFLEHSRIYYFRNDLAHDVMLSSADWMSRNLFRRIEVAFPILDKTLKRRVLAEGLNPYLKDNVNAWELEPDWHYQRRKTRAKQVGFSAQQHLMDTLGTPGAALGDG